MPTPHPSRPYTGTHASGAPYKPPRRSWWQRLLDRVKALVRR